MADALRGIGLSVVCHDERYPQGTPDEKWLPEVGALGWVLLTKDARMRSSSEQRQLLLNAGVRAFILSGANLTGDQMAAAFHAAAPRMYRLTAGEVGRPFIATVSPSGIVRLAVRGRRRS